MNNKPGIKKSTLINLRDYIKNGDSKNFEIASTLCSMFGIPFEEKEFVMMEASTREVEDYNEVIPSIIIHTNRWELEIDILSDRYFLNREWNNNEYQFVKQFRYNTNELINQTFSLEVNEDVYIALKESYSFNALCLDSDEKTLVRTHQDTAFPNIYDGEVGRVKTFTNEVTGLNTVYYNEVVYFESDEDLYDVTINKREDAVFLAGATLNNPEFFLEKTEYQEDDIIYEELGLLNDDYDDELKRPTIFCYGKYLDEGVTKEYQLKIRKNSDILEIGIIDDSGEKSYNFNNRDIGPINIHDIEFLIDILFTLLDDKEYKNSILDYIQDINYKLEYRQANDLNDVNCYNNDKFDRIINEGKFNSSIKRKTIEQRGFELYNQKEELLSLFNGIDSPYLDINNKLSI